MSLWDLLFGTSLNTYAVWSFFIIGMCLMIKYLGERKNLQPVHEHHIIDGPRVTVEDLGITPLIVREEEQVTEPEAIDILT